jgi:hypothetical protein
MSNDSHAQNGHGRHGKKHGHFKKQNGSSNHYVEVEDSSSPSFVARISSIPLLYDGVSTVTSYVKSAPYGEFVLDKAGNTLTAVQKYAQPYVDPVHQRLQPTIVKVDELAVKALNNLEQKFPIVSQPTSVILDSVTKPPLQYYNEVKKTVGTNLTEPATQTATTIARGVNQRASVLMDNYEAVVERWLPAETSKARDDNQVMRLYDITASLPVRVSTLVGAQLDHHQIPHTAEDFKRLRDASSILRETTLRIESLTVQLNEWVAISKGLATETIPSTLNQKVVEARVTLINGFDSTVTVVTANEKVQFYTQELVATLDKAATYVKDHGPTLPEFVQVRLNPLFTFVTNQYQLVAEELKKPNVLPSDKAKNVIVLTQQQVLPLMKKSLDDFTEHIRNYQTHYLAESERVLDGFKTSLKNIGVPVK